MLRTAPYLTSDGRVYSDHVLVATAMRSTAASASIWCGVCVVLACSLRSLSDCAVLCLPQVAVLTIIDLVAKVGFNLYFLLNFGTLVPRSSHQHTQREALHLCLLCRCVCVFMQLQHTLLIELYEAVRLLAACSSSALRRNQSHRPLSQHARQTYLLYLLSFGTFAHYFSHVMASISLLHIIFRFICGSGPWTRHMLRVHGLMLGILELVHVFKPRAMSTGSKAAAWLLDLSGAQGA